MNSFGWISGTWFVASNIFILWLHSSDFKIHIQLMHNSFPLFPILGSWVGEDEHVWCRKAPPCKCAAGYIEWVVHPGVRVLHPSLQLQPHLQLHCKVPLQLHGGVWWPWALWTGPIQPKYGPRGEPHRVAEGVSVVRDQPEAGCEYRGGHRLLPQVREFLQARLLRGRTLFPNNADDTGRGTPCQPECYVGWLVEGWSPSGHIREGGHHGGFPKEDHPRAQLQLQRATHVNMLPVCKEVRPEHNGAASSAGP